MIYSSLQKQILQKLLLKYESSKTYKGDNVICQSFSIKPSDVFKEYEKDSADINTIEDFEKQCKLLEAEGLVFLTWKSSRLKKINAGENCENSKSDDLWSQYRKILGVKDKNERLNEEINFYSKYLESNKIVTQFCLEQIERLKIGKEAKYQKDEAEKIIELLLFILNNKDEILERELSISVLHDSKLWEKKYKSKVCKLLLEKGDYSEILFGLDEKEKIKALLEQHNIFDNPTYIYFKGDATIYFSDKNTIPVTAENPIALSSVSMKNIKKVEIKNSKVFTIENLTSFNRFTLKNAFAIYLSGYHNSAKQEFLKLIFEQNKNKKYFHFGDIDPDGFFILENLKAKTKIPFSPYKMSCTELQKYSAYTKALEENDITKAKTLIAKGLYVDEMNYMLKNNCKLEQEIVSWLEK